MEFKMIRWSPWTHRQHPSGHASWIRMLLTNRVRVKGIKFPLPAQTWMRFACLQKRNQFSADSPWNTSSIPNKTKSQANFLAIQILTEQWTALKIDWNFFGITIKRVSYHAMCSHLVRKERISADRKEQQDKNGQSSEFELMGIWNKHHKWICHD